MRRLARITLMIATAGLAAPLLADELNDGFRNPPNSARPRVWWHWMNGNVTIDGIEKDLAWMEKVGIGGMQNFDANLNTPQVVDKRLVYMDPEWKKAFKHAVELADKKGLEFAIAASPGWSETGGPWVTPADAMKKLVWSETIVSGDKRFNGKLASAPDVTGPYQTIKIFDFLAGLSPEKPKEPQRAGGDVAVIAVPTMAALPLPQARTTEGAAIDVAAISDSDYETAAEVPVGDGRGLELLYAKPVTARSLRFFIPHAKPPFYGAMFKPVLEAEVSGKWQKLAELSLGEAASTVSFPAVTAQRFRILIPKNSGPAPAGLGGSAPGAEELDIFSRPFPKTTKVADVQLSANIRVSDGPTKAGFDFANNYFDITSNDTSPGIAAGKVINLTSKLKPDGTLDWTPPKGSDWRVYRFGWSLTGKTNHPATPEATGLEVDKYDAGAVRRYLEHYLGMYRDAVGPELIGKRGIRALLTDSIEVGPSNWTAKMAEEFKARRGYDLNPWLPALAGEVIASPAATDKFLFDFRTTLGDLLADAHYKTVAKVAHEQGLIVYGEAHENGRPVLGDDLAMRSHADVPMAALWTWNRGEKPRSTLIGDMRGAASVAHVYGQNLVAAESMTSANSPWAFAPRDLKRIIDLEFASGVNRPVIHTSVHQPLDDKQPGFSLMIFGQYFNRHDSWASMAKPWVDYLSRSSFMLQQGRNHADIAYFYGEESPVTGLWEYDVPKGLPTKYAYDFVNADMLRDALTVEGSEIVAKGGARYKALVLGGRSQMMTLGTLKRVAAMVEAGAKLIGEKPKASPSFANQTGEFAALADKLWVHPRVIATSDIESGMAKAGVSPDFAHDRTKPDSEILFLHRKLADGDIYFLNNRQNREEKLEARFRVTGKAPELWDAISGESTALPFTIQGNETVVPMTLAAEDAKFVVFRKDASAGAPTGITGNAPMQATPLNLTWKVSFQPGRGAPAGVAMAKLQPLNASADPGIKYFSGVATYTTSFPLPKKAKAGAPLWLDLGEVGDVAEVRVNGKEAGTVWFAPNRVEIGKLVKTGTNALEVRVANTWVNRLIGDKQPGATKVTFVTAPLTYKKDAPLRPSGLIGPVTIIGPTE